MLVDLLSFISIRTFQLNNEVVMLAQNQNFVYFSEYNPMNKIILKIQLILTELFGKNLDRFF